jgi:signal transduction histidine kinase/CheY-like chemotaxis protein
MRNVQNNFGIKLDIIDYNSSDLNLAMTMPVTESLNGISDTLASLLIILDTRSFLIPLLHTGNGLGASGEAYLINQQFTVMNNLKFPIGHKVVHPFKLDMKTKASELAILGFEGIIETIDYRGVKTYATYKNIRITPGNSWGMVVKKDKKEIIHPIIQNILLNLAIVFLGLLTGIILAVLISNQLTTNLKKLHNEIEKIKKGNFDIKAPPISYDEVGELTKIFVDMASSIKDLHNNLEDKVKQRTIELEHANVMLQDRNKEIAQRTDEYQNLNEEYLALNEELQESNNNLREINNELQLSEEQLKEAKLKAEESDRLKMAFLANMSHEIRTPMNGILGFADLLAEKELSHEKREYYANIVKSSSQQLLNIISDIIDISKIEAGEFTLSYATFELIDFLDEMTEQARILLKQKNKEHINLLYTLKANKKSFTTDMNRLAQIVLNLLSNAIKYTEKGSIELICETIENKIKIEVIDTGRGIDKSKHKLIFERFRQANEVNSFEGGTGLGLSICKALVEKMDGEIGVESEPGKGSMFYCIIPGKKNIEPPKQEIIESKTIFSKEKIKILFVEDEEINYLYLLEILKNKKFELYHAINGLEAVKLFKKRRPNIVLMDIKMPRMNGFEALKEIKKINSGVPVVAITAYAMSGDKTKALNAGFNSYLSKPLTQEKLLATINQYI